MTREELLKAKEELQSLVKEGKIMEIANVIGEPLDPLRPYPKVVERICEITDPVEPKEDVFIFDVEEDERVVYYIDSNGEVQSLKVTPATPSQVAFADILTQEYYVTFSDLLTAKYDVLGKKKNAITRALNAIEIKRTVKVHDAGISNGNKIVLESGETKFAYPHLIKMRDLIKDYGDNFVLLVGSQVDQDIALWDYDENKYTSLKDQLDSLKIEVIRIAGKVTIDGNTVDLIKPGKAILVALNTEAGKPCIFARKLLDPIRIMAGEVDKALQRATIISPAIMPVGSKRIPAVGVVGFESIATVLRNTKAVAGFYRDNAWVAED